MYFCTQTTRSTSARSPTHTPWLYQLDRGEAVEVLDEQGLGYIAWTGQYGWCWAEYLGTSPQRTGCLKNFGVELE